MDLSSSLSQHRAASARRLSLLAALPVVLAAGMLMSPPSVQAATDGAHTTKKAAKANPMQRSLDLSAAGARDAGDEDPVDIGDEEELDDSLLEDDE